MDSLTHIVLGATLGEILAGKRFGKKAMLIGAVANSLPDIDFVAGAWMSPAQYFLAHRGFTHSFFFVLLAAAFLALVIQYVRSFKISFRYWLLFFFIELLTHILLDSLNAYGVGWFEPFSHSRISYDILFVADPFFTIGLVIACIALIFLKSESSVRIKIAATGLVVSLSYTGYAAINKTRITSAVEKSFTPEKLSPTKLLITPTPLNCWLWYVVADSGDGYFIAYRSVFDQAPSTTYQYFPKHQSLLDSIRKSEETNQLILLSRNFFTIEKHNDTLVFNNLRFGQVNGWENPKASFIFRYNLEKSNSLFTIQHGRFAGWNKKTALFFINRIRGN